MIDQASVNIFWFKRVLKLHDNHGLFKVLQAGNVISIFIFDKEILDKIEDKKDKRINFVYKELSN